MLKPDLKDFSAFYYYSGSLEFINPDQFLSKIKLHQFPSQPICEIEQIVFKKLNEANYIRDDFPMGELSYKKFRRVLKLNKGMPDWHAFSRLFNQIRGRINSSILGGDEEESYLFDMINDFRSPKYSIRLGGLQHFPFDPDMFTYYLTADGTRGELVYTGRQNYLKTLNPKNLPFASNRINYNKTLGTT